VGLQYTHYIREDVGVTMGAQTVAVAVGESISPAGTFAGTASLVALPLGVRGHPLRASRGAFRPYLAASAGPAIGLTEGVFTGGGIEVIGSHSQTTLFAHLGVGLDYFPARSFALGVSGGYNQLANFSQPVGSQKDHSGPEVSFSFGWLFGRGRTSTPLSACARRRQRISKRSNEANEDERRESAAEHAEYTDVQLRCGFRAGRSREQEDLCRQKHKTPAVIDNRMAAPQHVCTKDSDHRLNLSLLQSGVDMGQVQSEQLCVRKIKVKER
jgi:hypothetical protein